jgi:hypothetical protein
MLRTREITVSMNRPEKNACALVQCGKWQLLERLMRIGRDAVVCLDAKSP